MNEKAPHFDSPPRRIVSLVPSLTESLFALGVGDRVVGITDWCVHPADAMTALPKVGGTKNPEVDAIVRLAPDLVIANQEENTRRSVEELQARGQQVWVTYPRTVLEGAALLGELADVLGLEADDPLRRELVEVVRSTVMDAERDLLASDRPAAPRVFCPIWKEPYMAVGADTYVHDMLRLCGGANPFAEAGDRRYPIVEESEIVAAQPEVVLLPDEPYAFAQADADEIATLDIPAAANGRIHLIDGTWVSWYGPRIIPAVRALRQLLMPT